MLWHKVRILKVLMGFLMVFLLLEPARAQENSLESLGRESLERIESELQRLRREREKLLGKPESEGAPKIELSDQNSPVLWPRRRVLTLTLDAAIRMALKNDFGGLIAAEQARAQAYAIPRALANFDPNFEASISRSRSRRTSIFQNPLTGLPADAVTNQSDRLSLSTSISKTFSYGTSLSFRWDQTRSETKGATNNPQIDASLSATLTQPLLKGRGFEVNLATLTNATRDRANAYSNFSQTLQSLILDVRRAYWAVVTAETNLTVQKDNLEGAYSFLNDERRKFALGSAKDLDVALAKATVARRMEAVIRAEADLENSRDQLLNRIAPSVEILSWEVFIVPLDRPTFVPQPSLGLASCVETADAHRLDLEIAARNVEKERTNLLVAKNNVLPSLDLSITGGLAATAEKHHNAYRTFDPPEDAFNIRAGLTLRFPLFMRAEKASVAQAKHNLRVAELRLLKTKSDAILEIRLAIRQIISSRERVIVNQQSVKHSENQLKTERDSARLGVSIARNVLDAQQQLANAQLNLQQSLIDYRESIASYNASLGLLLYEYKDALPKEALLRGTTSKNP